MTHWIIWGLLCFAAGFAVYPAFMGVVEEARNLSDKEYRKAVTYIKADYSRADAEKMRLIVELEDFAAKRITDMAALSNELKCVLGAIGAI